jgi:hypothetical protein
MTSALKCGHQHSYRLSAYERRDNDFCPTPSDLVVSLPLGFPKLGLKLPQVALDPCGGDGALRRGLAPFGVDVRLTDLSPKCTRSLTATLRANRSTPPRPDI